MTPVFTGTPDAGITITPSPDQQDSTHHTGSFSRWATLWNISKGLVKSIPPNSDAHHPPGQQPEGPWIQLNSQPKELALRLAQKAIPADSYFNTINQMAMACLALASLPGCRGQTPQDH